MCVLCCVLRVNGSVREICMYVNQIKINVQSKIKKRKKKKMQSVVEMKEKNPQCLFVSDYKAN